MDDRIRVRLDATVDVDELRAEVERLARRHMVELSRWRVGLLTFLWVSAAGFWWTVLLLLVGLR